MKDRKLASRYAHALLSVLRDPGTQERADSFLTALAHAFETSTELRDAMLNPAVARPDRVAILRAIAELHQMPNEVANFLETLVANNRTAALPSIALVFHEEREREQGIVPAELTTAVPIADPVKERARTTLEQMTGRSVQLTFSVEPALLGGAVTRVGSMIYDGSLRGQLERLKRRMAEG